MSARAPIAIAMLLSLADVPTALARPPKVDDGVAQARDLFTIAEGLYRLGRYEEALVEYQHAYQAAPLPGFHFNIAQCQRQLGRYPEASAGYRDYLAKLPTASNRAVVEDLLREVDGKIVAAKQAEEQRIADARAAQAAEEAAAEKAARDAAADKAAREAAARVAVAEPTVAVAPARDKKRTYAVVGGVIGGVVVVGAGLGLGLGLGLNRSIAVPESELGRIDLR